MGFVGKIAKATENFAIKYKSLYINDLYLIFHRFPVLFINLPAVHEILPYDVGRGSDRGYGIEERLGHPHGEDRIFLAQRLPSGHRIAVAAAQHAARLELHQAEYERHGGQCDLGAEIGPPQIENERRGASDDHDQRHEPHPERKLAVRADPPREAGHQEAARLRRGERHDEQRCDAGQDLRQGADAAAGERQHDGRNEGDDQIADEAVGRHQRDVGPQHAADDHRRHGDGGQHADHAPLRHHRIERPEQQVYPHAGRDLEEQHPGMEHARPHVAGTDPAEGEKEHQKDQRRRNHVVRPRLDRRHGAAQQRPDHHAERHGDRLHVAAEFFGQPHRIRRAARALWPKCPCRRPGRPGASTLRPSPCPSPSRTARRSRR